MTPELRSASRRAIQVLKADGQVLSAGRACLFILEELGWGWKARLFVHRPFIWGIELGYRIVAANRPLFSRIFKFLTSRKGKALRR